MPIFRTLEGKQLHGGNNRSILQGHFPAKAVLRGTAGVHRNAMSHRISSAYRMNHPLPTTGKGAYSGPLNLRKKWHMPRGKAPPAGTGAASRSSQPSVRPNFRFYYGYTMGQKLCVSLTNALAADPSQAGSNIGKFGFIGEIDNSQIIEQNEAYLMKAQERFSRLFKVDEAEAIDFLELEKSWDMGHTAIGNKTESDAAFFSESEFYRQNLKYEKKNQKLVSAEGHAKASSYSFSTQYSPQLQAHFQHSPLAYSDKASDSNFNETSNEAKLAQNLTVSNSTKMQLGVQRNSMYDPLETSHIFTNSPYWSVPTAGCFTTKPLFARQNRSYRAANEASTTEIAKGIEDVNKISLLAEAEAFIRSYEDQGVNLYRMPQPIPRHLLIYLSQVCARAWFDPRYRRLLLDKTKQLPSLQGEAELRNAY